MKPWLRTFRRLVFQLSIALTIANVGWTDGRSGPTCFCSQIAGGWLLFPDSSRRTPDFWWQDEVIVQEIATCPHAIQFLFMAEERGNPYLMALVFTTPPSDLRGRDEPPTQRRSVAALVAKVSWLMDGTLDEADHMDFRHMPLDQRPRILQPWRRLSLVWHDQEVELRGYLDVYMTQLL